MNVCVEGDAGQKEERTFDAEEETATTNSAPIGQLANLMLLLLDCSRSLLCCVATVLWITENLETSLSLFGYIQQIIWIQDFCPYPYFVIAHITARRLFCWFKVQYLCCVCIWSSSASSSVSCQVRFFNPFTRRWAAHRGPVAAFRILAIPVFWAGNLVWQVETIATFCHWDNTLATVSHFFFAVLYLAYYSAFASFSFECLFVAIGPSNFRREVLSWN